MNAELVLAPDAAMALGIASTAMPFARTPEAQAERWLRILRLHGQAGAALQSLGVGERRLVAAEGHDEALRALADEADETDDGDLVERVSDQAAHLARRRSAACVATTDLLLAVMDVYGQHFDRVLEAHGTDRRELADRLGIR